MAYHVNNLGVLIGESPRPDEPSRRISIDKAIHYTRHTLQGLSCLHHAGIIHRDIKPFNLLITDQDTVKICDFGLSKLHGEKFAGPANLKVGSAWYAPPEQESDPDRVDVTADIYATGVTFYRMLTGTLPADDYHPVATYNTDLDQSWDGFICRAIARNANDRFTSANEMLHALGELDAILAEQKERFLSCAGNNRRSCAKKNRIGDDSAPQPLHQGRPPLSTKTSDCRSALAPPGLLEK